jgi:hypothetical protein
VSLCECGCGAQTNISTVTDPRRGAVKGQPRRFLMGHNSRKAVTIDYRKLHLPDRAVRLHRLRAERALGKPLPPKAIVHHADGSKGDQAQLVICQDQAYHMYLHARMRVKAAGGNPNTDAICGSCHMVLPRECFFVKRHRTAFGVSPICKQCKSRRDRQFYLRKNTAAL